MKDTNRKQATPVGAFSFVLFVSFVVDKHYVWTLTLAGCEKKEGHLGPLFK